MCYNLYSRNYPSSDHNSKVIRCCFIVTNKGSNSYSVNLTIYIVVIPLVNEEEIDPKYIILS